MGTKQVTPDVIFSTCEFALMRGLSLSSASHHLRVLAKRGEIIRITRGVWARIHHPYFTPLACIPWILGKEEGYVSFLTALHRHGALSQIPSTIQVATTGHSRKLNTSVGQFEFFQLKPEAILSGVVLSDTYIPFRIASLEKALLDTLYIATRKGRRFKSLPELDLDLLNKQKLKHLLGELKLPAPVSRAITKRLDGILEVK